jgi:hypothetical protein
LACLLTFERAFCEWATRFVAKPALLESSNLWFEDGFGPEVFFGVGIGGLGARAEAEGGDQEDLGGADLVFVVGVFEDAGEDFGGAVGGGVGALVTRVAALGDGVG